MIKRIVLCGVLLGPVGLAHAWLNPSTAREDRIESPYFEVKGTGVERLLLKRTSARIQVTGPIANVVVTQEYANEGKTPIEATYVFPGSTRSAVHALTMTVGGRVRRARISEKQAARVTYERAKQEGKSAALLEQKRPNMFQMNVANVMPGETIKVELAYTELLVPREGVYELVYPTVVGPRYDSAPAAGTAAPDTARGEPGAGFGQSYLPEGQFQSEWFTLSATLAAGMPVHDVTSPSHPLKLETSDERVNVAFDPVFQAGANRDFVLRWRLAGQSIASGLLVHEGPENTFLLTVEPPRRVADEETSPREFIFVVDTSGSMTGYPLEVTRSLIQHLVGALRPIDRFNVMTFSGGQQVLAERSLAATRGNIELALDVLRRREAGGSTELMPALRHALAMPREPGCSRSFLVITDGYVTCEAEAFRLVRESLSTANMFAFGIGTAVNRQLIEGLARAGRAEPFVVIGETDTREAADAFQRYVQRPVLTDIRVEALGLEAVDIEPARQPDLLAERPIVVTGKWKGPRRGTVTVTGLAAGRPWTRSFDMAHARTSEDHAALPLLWARERIAWLTDLKDAGAGGGLETEILKLGLAYGLLTEYTSFVAVDDVVRATTPAETVSQPLPLPVGVSQAATGAVVPTVPEPETWALLLVAALAGLWTVQRRPGAAL